MALSSTGSRAILRQNGAAFAAPSGHVYVSAFPADFGSFGRSHAPEPGLAAGPVGPPLWHSTEMDMMAPVASGQVWAEDTAGDGPPLVLLHPGVGDSRIWDLMLPRLADQFRVIRYDVRGYGRSAPATAPYRLVDDLIAVLDHLRLHRVHLVGCSMGGATAVNLALADPARVTGMVLLCPGISGYPWPAEPELDAELERLQQVDDNDGLVAVAMREWAAAGTDEYALAQMRSAARAWPNEASYQRPDPPAFDQLGQVSVPTIIMVGDLDRPALIACNEQAALRIPRCRLTRMPGVDHLPPLRVPDLITETILDHFRGLS
jgi:3-oxoadipate enol-lactonase